MVSWNAQMRGMETDEQDRDRTSRGTIKLGPRLIRL